MSVSAQISEHQEGVKYITPAATEEHLLFTPLKVPFFVVVKIHNYKLMTGIRNIYCVSMWSNVYVCVYECVCVS